MDSLGEIRSFVRVVESRGFSGAARSLGLSTAMVSKHVAALERRYGVRLLDRNTRGAAPTEAGQRFYDRCLAVLGAIDAAEAELATGTQGVRGTLRVSMPVEFANLHFGALLPRFLSRHPGLTVHLLATNDVVDLVEDGVDVAVRFVRQYDGALPGRQLGITRILLLASPEYVAAHGAPRSVEEVGERDGLVYGSPAPWLEFPCWTNGTEGRLRLKPHVVSSSSDVLRSALVQGIGIAVLTTMQAGSDLRDGRLVRLMPELDLGCMRVYVVYPNRRHLPAKVRAFVEFLGECFGGRPEVDPFVDGLHRP